MEIDMEIGGLPFWLFLAFLAKPSLLVQFLGKQKLDWVGLLDYRPSNDKLHHFVQKKHKQKKM